MTWILIWAGCWALSWFLAEETWLNEWGEISVSERVFFIVWSLGGPISLLLAVINWLGSLNEGRPRRIVRTRVKRPDGEI